MRVEWLNTQLSEPLGVADAKTIGTGIVLGIGLVLYLAAPVVVRQLVDLRRCQVVNRYVGDPLETVQRSISWPFPTRAVIRLLQAAVISLVVLSLLPLWGYQTQALVLADVFATALPWVTRVLMTALLLSAGVVATRFLGQELAEYTADAKHVTEHQAGVAFRVLQLLIFGAVGIAVISLWGVDLTGLFVGAGFVGIVFVMAARRTLGSLIAGLVLMFSRPFEIGDWVEIGEHEGIVREISVINTRLRSFNDETIVIPNDTVANSTVVDFSDSQRLRLRLEIGIGYETDIERARGIAQEAMEEADEILKIPNPTVVPTAFEDSAIGLRLLFWIDHPSKPKRWKAHTAVLERVKRTFDREGITIPFPQRELSGSVDQPVRQPDEASAVRPDANLD